MNIAVLSQGLLTRIVERFRLSYVYSKHDNNNNNNNNNNNELY